VVSIILKLWESLNIDVAKATVIHMD